MRSGHSEAAGLVELLNIAIDYCLHTCTHTYLAGEAVRVRVGGGVTQLTQAAGAARTAAYQETHVQVTLAADTTTSTAAGSTAGVTATLSGHKRPSAAQPFFLRANKAAAASQVRLVAQEDM
jgi:hypothetical protein